MKKSNALAALERLRSMDPGEALAVLRRYAKPGKKPTLFDHAVAAGYLKPSEEEWEPISLERQPTPEETLAQAVARLTKALEQAGEQLQPPAAVAEAQAAVVEAIQQRGGGRPRVSSEKAAKQRLAAEAVAEWRAWRKEQPSPKPDLEAWLLEDAPEKFDELGLDPQEVQKLAKQHADNQRKRKQTAPRRRAR